MTNTKVYQGSTMKKRLKSTALESHSIISEVSHMFVTNYVQTWFQGIKLHRAPFLRVFLSTICPCTGFFLRFRFGDRKEILRDRSEEFERPFSIDVISGHYILRDRWRNLRDRFGPSKHLKKTLPLYIIKNKFHTKNRGPPKAWGS